MSFFAGFLTAKIFFKGLIDKGTAQKAVERAQDDDIERKRLIGKQQQHQIQQTRCDQQLQRGSPFHDRHDAGIFEVCPDIHVQQHEQRIKILRDAEIEEDGNCRGDDHRASFHAKDDRVAGDGRRGKQEQEAKHGPFQEVGPEFRKESVEHPFVPGLPHHIQDDPVQSAGCRRNGDHRQAAQQIQKIQSDQPDPILAQHQPDALPPGGFQCRKNTASLFFGRKCHKSTLYRAGSHLSLINGLSFAFKKQGFELVVARTLKEADSLWVDGKYDLLVLDVSLPDGTGFEFCKKVRQVSKVPIIFLTAADEEMDIIMGLDIGGDDYITKPFKLGVLVSRVNALLRRAKDFSSADTQLESNGMKVLLLQGQAFKNGKLLDLTAAEYKLLCLFMKNPNMVLTKEQILDKLWDCDGNYIDSSTLTVYMRRLRIKIEDNPSEPQMLLTVRGMGYKWNVIG